jgi:NADH:ubiquinone oxidoreductase subunit 4 (subunit M)
MKIYQVILLFLLILVPLMAIFSILSYKLEDSFDISSVKCIALTATLFNLFLSVLLLIKYDFDVLGYQFITDLTTSFSKFNQSNIKGIQNLDSLLSLNFYSNFDYYYYQFGLNSLNMINWLCENIPGFESYLDFHRQVIGLTLNQDIMQNIGYIPSFLKSIKVGVDEKSLFFILLTTFITPICILANWSDIQEIGKLKLFLILFLLLEILQIALFLVLDLFWFYIFFESVLIPLFLLVII